MPLPIVIVIVIVIASPTLGRIAGRIGPRLPLTIGPLIVAAGFVLVMRIGSAGSYATTTLPAMFLIALGIACAVAPLTTAVPTAVEPSHAGVASGFNSAVARGGSLIATALLGAVLASHGPALVAMFHAAMLVGGVAALAAGVCAFVWLGDSAGSNSNHVG